MATEALMGLVVAIISAVGGILGMLFVKGRLADVIVAPSMQQTTAVDTMAELLSKTVDGLVSTSAALASMATEFRGHETDESHRFQFTRSSLDEICAEVQQLKEQTALLVYHLAEEHKRVNDSDD